MCRRCMHLCLGMTVPERMGLGVVRFFGDQTFLGCLLVVLFFD